MPDRDLVTSRAIGYISCWNCKPIKTGEIKLAAVTLFFEIW